MWRIYDFRYGILCIGLDIILRDLQGQTLQFIFSIFYFEQLLILSKEDIF